MSFNIGSAPSSRGSGGNKRMSRRYRTVAYRSEVDENLFGEPNRVKQAEQLRSTKSGGNIGQQQQQSSMRQSQQSQSGSPERQRKQYIKHVTKDLIREILVPEDNQTRSVVIDKGTYERLLKNCNYKSKGELEAEKRALDDDKDRIIREINERKRVIQHYDSERKKNEKLEEIDQLAKEESEYLLKKANEMRQEDDDDIKRLNEMILNAKVCAIRDAQLLEKQQITKDVGVENKRLDMMMELNRVNAIKIQEDIEKKRKQDLVDGAKVILKQIEENRQEKLLKDEMREQENQAMLEFLEQLQAEDYDELKKRKDQQKKLAGDLLLANREIEKQKEVRKQQDMIADLKIIEYQKEKAVKEAAYEAEQERKKAEKENEVAHLRAQQERARDLQAEKDALRAKREQERKEREWRQKERLELNKKRQTEEEMRLAREWQIKNKEHYLAMEAVRDKSEFQKVLKTQLELAQKEKDQEERVRHRQKSYNENLQKQIRQNELVKIQERKQFFEEGNRLDEEARTRRAKLEEAKRKKLDELRNAGIPEKYCAEIERKINGPVHVK